VVVANLSIVRIVSFGWVAAGGVVAIGMNSAGTILAIGLNAAAPIAIGGINAVGIVAIGGVNAIGAWGIGGVNAMGNPVAAAVLAGVYLVVTLVVAVVKRAVVDRDPEPETVPLGELPDDGEFWTRADRLSTEDETLTLHAGRLLRTATLRDGARALASGFAPRPARAYLVRLRVSRRPTESGDYRTSAAEAVLEATEILPARTFGDALGALGASLRTRWTAHVVVAALLVAALLAGRAAGWLP
jgi:hypothetical protein